MKQKFTAICAEVEWMSQQLLPSVGPLHFQSHCSPNHCKKIVEVTSGHDHNEYIYCIVIVFIFVLTWGALSSFF